MHKYEGYSDQQVLETLRELTKLGPVAKLKVAREQALAEKSRQSYIKQNPSDIIETDFTQANELEYALRINALANKLEKDWKGYEETEHDDFGLIDYTEYQLSEYMKEKYQEAKKK